MTDPAKAEVTALEVVLNRLEVSSLIEKGLGLISHPLLFTSMGLVLVAFMFRMAGNVTRNAMGEDAEHPGKALAVLACTCLALVLYRYALDLGVRMSQGVLSIFKVVDLRSMAAILDGLLDKHFEGLRIWDFIDPGSMFMGLALVAYGITALLLILMVGIYGVALAYSFIILIILGYLVIPMSLASRNFDMTSGWIKMVLTILMWPILERIVFITSSWIMLDVAQAKELSLVDGPDAAAAACIAFTILNCMMCAGVYYAPRMAAAICINSGDLSPSLEPFGKAAFGATMAVKMSSLLAFGMAKKVGGNLAHNTFKGLSERFAAPGQGSGGGGPQSNFNNNKGGYSDGQSNVSPRDFINSPDFSIGMNLDPKEKGTGFNRSMGMNADAGHASKTGKTVSRVGEPGTSTATKQPSGNMFSPQKSAPAKSSFTGAPVDASAKPYNQPRTSLNNGADSSADSKAVSSMFSAKKPAPAISPFTGAPVDASAKAYNQPRTSLNNGTDSIVGSKDGSSLFSPKKPAPAVSPYTGAQSQADAKPYTKTRTPINSYQSESKGMSPSEKSSPSSGQGASAATSGASPKSQEKTPEQIKKDKAKKNAIIRQNLNKDQSFKWSPKNTKEDPQT